MVKLARQHLERDLLIKESNLVSEFGLTTLEVCVGRIPAFVAVGGKKWGGGTEDVNLICLLSRLQEAQLYRQRV